MLAISAGSLSSASSFAGGSYGDGYAAVGHAGGGHYSFTSRGVELDRAPVLPAVRAQ